MSTNELHDHAKWRPGPLETGSGTGQDSVRTREATSQAVLDAVAGFIDKHAVGPVAF